MAARLKLPAVYAWHEFADAGGLICYGTNLPDLYRQSARLVDKILKGAKPSDLPFEVPTRWQRRGDREPATKSSVHNSVPALAAKPLTSIGLPIAN